MSDHMREQFEDTMSSQGEWPQAIEKDLAGGYKLAITATAWETWQPAWEAGQEMMKSRVKELEADRDSWRRVSERLEREKLKVEAATLGLTKTLVEMDAEKAKLVEALEDIGASWHGVNTELERYMRNVARLALAATASKGVSDGTLFHGWI